MHKKTNFFILDGSDLIEQPRTHHIIYIISTENHISMRVFLSCANLYMLKNLKW